MDSGNLIENSRSIFMSHEALRTNCELVCRLHGSAHYITSQQFAQTTEIFEAIEKMSTRLIQYLERSHRRRRD